MLNVALNALAKGFTVFPLAPGQKTPHRLAGNWGETATNDSSRVIYFWTQVDSNANVAVACKPSQLLVVDLDVAKEDWNLRGTEWAYLHEGYGPRVSGEEVFDEMAFKLGTDSPGDLDTYTVRTGSGGLHLYYWWPSHWPTASQASPVKGVVDVRGNGGQWGGYVLAEGCVTSAGMYRGVGPRVPALPPEWIRKLVVEKPAPPKVKRPGGIRQPGAVSWSGLVDSVRNAPEGNRNNALLWSARCMCSDGATEQEAKDTLGPAAEQAGLQTSEIDRTIESGYRTQRQKDGT